MDNKNDVFYKKVNITFVMKIINSLLFLQHLLLIFILTITGFEINGYYQFFGFERALLVHDVVAIIFAISFFGSLSFYFLDFKGWVEVVKTKGITPQKIYLLTNCILVPIQILSGLAYFFFPFLRSARIISGVGFFAHSHTFMTYAIIAGILVHLYMVAIGRSPISSISAILGYEKK